MRTSGPTFSFWIQLVFVSPHYRDIRQEIPSRQLIMGLKVSEDLLKEEDVFYCVLVTTSSDSDQNCLEIPELEEEQRCTWSQEV